jgi:hypothetical protein
VLADSRGGVKARFSSETRQIYGLGSSAKMSGDPDILLPLDLSLAKLAD